MGSSSPAKARATVVAMGLCLALAGCDSTSPDSSSHESGSPSDEPTAGITESSTLKCADQMSAGPPERLKVIAGVAALPEAATFGPLEANADPAGDDPQTRLFAKQPILIRAGQTFDLIVPPEERDHLAIGWGNNPMDLTWQLHVDCQHAQKPWANAKWLGFAGGYFVPQRKCVSLIVRSDGQDHRVKIGAGARCKDASKAS